MKTSNTRNRRGAAAGGGREAAEAVAIAALSFLAADPERLGRFLATSGLGPETLRTAASEPNFLAGVLDHVVENEQLLVLFAEHEGIDPFDVTRARMRLAGPHQEAQ